MRLCHATALIGISIAGCNGPAPSDGTQSNEPETIGLPPVSVVPLTDTERELARLQGRRQAIIDAEMDEDVRARFLEEIRRQEEDIRTCQSRGDRIVSFGPSTWCSEIYNDGGKVCSDSSECEGRCVVEEPVEVAAGVEATGMCQAEEPVSSCYATITKGIAGLTICIN